MRADAETVGRAAIFAALDPADRAALALCFRGRRYTPGEMVFHEGDPGASLFLVGEGSFVAVVRSGGMPREIGRFGPGGIIGASALLDRGPRRHTLTAVGPATAFEIEADAVELLRPTAPHAARALITASIRAWRSSCSTRGTRCGSRSCSASSWRRARPRASRTPTSSASATSGRSTA